MKLLERLKWIKAHMQYPVLLVKGEELEEVREALEKAEKYRWHDIRKDKTDLPDKETTVDVILDGRFFSVTYQRGTDQAYYIPESGFFGSDKDKIVIAWKYIEPFGGDDE